MKLVNVFYIFLAVFVFLLLLFAYTRNFSGRVVDESCSPNYVCENWRSCVGEFQNRTCRDLKCGEDPIIERRLCSKNCVPQVVCSRWSSCIYLDKINDIVSGQISFNGYKQRECIDSSGCAENFNEYEVCKDLYPVTFSKQSICGRDYIIGVDSGGRKSAIIDLASWKDSRQLYITFTQSDNMYCPSCFDGIKNNGETGVDCGGNCKVCRTEKINKWFSFNRF